MAYQHVSPSRLHTRPPSRPAASSCPPPATSTSRTLWPVHCCLLSALAPPAFGFLRLTDHVAASPPPSTSCRPRLRTRLPPPATPRRRTHSPASCEIVRTAHVHSPPPARLILLTLFIMQTAPAHSPASYDIPTRHTLLPASCDIPTPDTLSLALSRLMRFRPRLRCATPPVVHDCGDIP